VRKCCVKESSVNLTHPEFFIFCEERKFLGNLWIQRGEFSNIEECGHEWIVWGALLLSAIKLRKGVSLLRELPLEDAALELLQLAPLHLSPWRKDVFYYCPTGVGP